jgi:hypothetical protein
LHSLSGGSPLDRWRSGVPYLRVEGHRIYRVTPHVSVQDSAPESSILCQARNYLEDSPLGLDKWLPAMWMIASNRNGISSWELHRALKVTQKNSFVCDSGLGRPNASHE